MFLISYETREKILLHEISLYISLRLITLMLQISVERGLKGETGTIPIDNLFCYFALMSNLT